MTREPEWDDTQREWALGWARYQAGICRDCGSHLHRTHDDTVGRAVEHVESKCLDCEAIEKTRAAYHADQQHESKNVRCDCADQTFFIQDYVPIPEEQRRPARR